MEPKALIEIFLGRIRRLRWQTQALHGTYIILTYIIGSYLLACLIVWAYKPLVEWTLPAIGIFLGGLVYIISSHFIRVLFVPFSQDNAALLADSRYPHLNNALINSSQLGRRLNHPQFNNTASLEFIRELHRRTGPVVSKIDPSTVIDQSGITISRNWFLGTFFSLTFIALLIPNFLKKGYAHWTDPIAPAQISEVQTTDKEQTIYESTLDNYSIESLNLTFHFPAYTGIKTKSIESLDGKIHVLPGTEVNIIAKTKVPVIGGDLVFNRKDNYAMSKENETSLTGNLLVKEKGFYQFSVKDKNGDKHLIAKKYPVTLDKDDSPSIILFLANPKPVYFNTDKVQLFYEAKDDFGINSVELIVIVNGKIKRIPVKKFKIKKKEAKDSHTWTLAQMVLRPGDEVQYYLEVKDNDNVFGPNTGQSEIYNFTIFDSEKEMENLIALQEKMTEQMIALLSTGLVEGASLENEPGNLTSWKQLFITSIDELIEIVSLAQQIHDRGESIDQFPQTYLNLLKNIIGGLSRIRRNQIEALSNLQNTIYKPTQAKFETSSPYAPINKQMTEHLEKDILFLIKMTNKQKLDRMVGLEKELNELTQTLREEFEKIKDGKFPPNSNELKNKINKIREILQKIMDQLSRQVQSMPDEFLNPNAFKRLNMDNFSAALEKMQDMINRGQIEEAIEKLKQITEDLQLLASQFNRADSEMDGFLDPETMGILDDTSDKLDQLKNRQQKLVEETTQINRDVRQQQSMQFKDDLNKLFTGLLQDVEAVRELFKENEKLLEEHVVMKQLEKLINKEFKISKKIKELSQATVDAAQLEKMDQNFHKLNEARKSHSRLSQEKDSLRVNEFRRFKEILPHLLKKYDSLKELAELQDLKEFANQFKQAYPDVLRWQNNLRTTPNLREDLSELVDKDMRQAIRLNNEISKKLGSMMRSIKKSYDSFINKEQKEKLKQMASQEHQMRGETEKLAQLLDKLNKNNPVIPPELSQRMDQTSRHMKRAEKSLEGKNIPESIESENQALKGLNDTRDMLKQMKSSNDKTGRAQRQAPRRLGTGSSPDSRRGGSQRMQKERVLLPSEDQYQAPKEFREEILNAMKKQTPKDYQRMVMEYYKNLVK